MSITTTTTRITHRWLMRKSKHELAGIIMANIDKIDLFKDQPVVCNQWVKGSPCALVAGHDGEHKWLTGD